MIPLPWKIGAGVFLAFLVAGGYFAWAAHEQAIGAAAVDLKNAKAVIAQHELDKTKNAESIRQLAQKLTDTETKVITVTEKVYAAPITRDCAQSPAMRAASDGLRELFPTAGQTGDRPGPTPAVPRPAAGAGQPKR